MEFLTESGERFELQRKRSNKSAEASVFLIGQGFRATLVQLRILKLKSEGLSYEEIAQAIGNKRGTIKGNLTNFKGINERHNGVRWETVTCVVQATERGLLTQDAILRLEQFADGQLSR